MNITLLLAGLLIVSFQGKHQGTSLWQNLFSREFEFHLVMRACCLCAGAHCRTWSYWALTLSSGQAITGIFSSYGVTQSSRSIFMTYIHAIGAFSPENLS